MIHIKKKDKVMVLSGKYKGQTGEVVRIFPKDMKAIVSKINIVKRHTRPTQTDPGGIREIEKPIPISKLQLICPKCGQRTKTKTDFLSDGKKVRICKKCGEMIL